ncbi:ATP-binding cassette domain-containing protein [Anaeromyxobacter diazotrophicus]|uniref:ABC transporter ATP-binding protein n=1 Tax=Anaeromyxobacter diazotrophicus TaxID=2590199 RepID=A0A7I9VTG1_9BACT|nr:ATP-binding cassette domain-containing protein [Anaeromyxobacter diazotrophicus]GEJ59237.1 ABC transporter ATP-binding protein [Anaeromyxobacter diazotrophicus]
MPRLRLERLTFAYADAAPILDGADLTLDPGYTGLVGENGAGKSTLLALVAGALEPSSGAVRVEPGGARVVLCPQRVDDPGPDALALAAREDGEARRLRDALHLEPADLARWATCSPGERKRWQLGAALAAGPDVLLLDEPTNHVDEAARALLLDALRRFRGLGVVVSHDRALLEALTSTTLRLHRGEARLYRGAYGVARAAWEAETAAAWDARAAAQDARRRAERRLDDARRARAAAERSRSGRGRDPRDRDARGMPAKNLAGWAEDRLGRQVGVLRREAARAAEAVPVAAVEKAIGRSVFAGFERAPRPWPLALARPLLQVDGRPLLRGVEVRLGRADRVRLAGPNGAGKTTLLVALLEASALPPEKVLVLPQELAPGEARRALEAVRRLPPEVRGRVLSIVAALGSDPERLLASLEPSPGEARKLLLALGLGRHAWALVLDEPTNHLDLPTVERLEATLAAYPGALLLVTHDDAFAARCTTSTWRIVSGRVER